ncbi:inner membrane protein [Escherichia coli]|uniref:Inner membrane protein n=1 Tax=Escherichia coli TaxID=562 RepID=A0A377DPG9_ECOLX|nr:inner membrane protein [Escherichia coli]
MFSPQSRLRHAVADTFAMVVYCSVVNMCIEVFLSGMSFEQSFYSRLVAIPGEHLNCMAIRYVP